MNSIIESLNFRYSTKIFDKSKKIPSNDWEIIEKSLVLTPSSFGLQPWKFVVITNEEMKKKLRPFSWNQSQIEDCSHLVVFCAKKNIDEAFIQSHVENIAKVRNCPLESLQGYKEMMKNSMKTNENHFEYSSNQTFIALGSILTISAMMKIDTCPVGGFEPLKYTEILNIEPEFRPCVVACFGYRSTEDKYSELAKVRKPKNEVIINVN